MKVAIVGSGISGLSAAWLLNLYNDHFKVTLFEKASYFGGHTHTVLIPPLDKQFKGRVSDVPVDTGFIVYNPVTYPNFMNFLKQIEIPGTFSDMSFSVSRDNGLLEWAGDSLWTIFAQWRNVLDFSRTNGIWVMLFDVIRFHWVGAYISKISDLAISAELDEVDQVLYTEFQQMTIGEFLVIGNYSPSFINNFLIPQTAAIWSIPPGTCLEEFPIMTLIMFFRNHCMLQLIGRPRWLTVSHGAREYVDKVITGLKETHLHTEITSITRQTKNDRSVESVVLTDSVGKKHIFDHVILATHADTSLKIIDNPTDQEQAVLSQVRYTSNVAVLHRDHQLMPKLRSTWSSWNYLTISDNDSGGGSGSSEKKKKNKSSVSVTYWMNRLQPYIPRATHGDIFLSINPIVQPDPLLVIDTYHYEHPVYDFGLVQAQKLMSTIANQSGIGYAGAWTNYAFHEDGCTSGLAAAIALGATPPFEMRLNGGHPTDRTLDAPVVGCAKVPSVNTYMQTVGHLLPTSNKYATPSPRTHQKEMIKKTGFLSILSLVCVQSICRTLGQTSLMQNYVLAIVPGIWKKRFNDYYHTRLVKDNQDSRPAVMLVTEEYVCAMLLGVRVIKRLEELVIALLAIGIGMPIVLMLMMLKRVRIVDSCSFDSPVKELVWVSARYRVVWV